MKKTLVLVIFVLVLGELGARAYYLVRRNIKPQRMISGVDRGGAQDAHPIGPTHAYSMFLPCSGREVTFTINKVGGRGPNWERLKPEGTTRIIAVGGSTTFGSESPDDATYPAFLETELRDRYGLAVEALNAGVPKRRLEQVVWDLESQVFPYQPDVVLYYEGFNNAIAQYSVYQHVDITVGRFYMDSPIAPLVKWLHGRSMLYTGLLEKTLFYLARKNQSVVPEVKYFEAQLRRLVRLLRTHGIVPVFVLQVTEVPEETAMRDLPLDDRKRIETVIMRAAEANVRLADATAPPMLKTLNGYQAQVLVEVVRRMGDVLDVPVIDPRPAFASYQGTDPLFCDVIHLTDQGNELLAQVIADELNLPSLARR